LVNPGTIRSTYSTILKGIPCAITLIFFYSPSCIESGDNKFAGEKRFFAKQIVPEILIFFFFRQIAFLISCSSFKQVVK
jgi:hypothetical protein